MALALASQQATVDINIGMPEDVKSWRGEGDRREGSTNVVGTIRSLSRDRVNLFEMEFYS